MRRGAGVGVLDLVPEEKVAFYQIPARGWLGLSPALLADSMTTLSRFRDDDIPTASEQLNDLKDFFPQ